MITVLTDQQYQDFVEEASIDAAESGADRELDYDWDEHVEWYIWSKIGEFEVVLEDK